ncbi:MAG: ABC transporter ATP-binding protein [Candidatus Moraniibacteriota bacterium]|nr:MAG: ABC transporter ATP-binding protein [Candidatus Moranbacteria bacterium]
MADPLIALRQLRIIYNQGRSNEVRALEETNLDIYREEYIIVYGPSGCGKSTLLYSIAGLQRPTYGNVWVDGKNLASFTRREEAEFHQSKIGMIFQAFYLIPSLSVIDNVCLPKTFRGESPEIRRKDGLALLRRFGIAEQMDKFPSQLSGGQKQRVAIARALINNPEIILADEPVGNLDSESAQNVLDILKELNEVDKKTILMVTHNAEHLLYADRIIAMKDGRIEKETVQKEKRAPSARSFTPVAVDDTISPELRILMGSFRSLSSDQLNVLLIPFKAKQLLAHTLSHLTEEQLAMAESFLKEYLFSNIDENQFTSKLDIDIDKGGAGWNKKQAKSFTLRIESLIREAKNIAEHPEEAHTPLCQYLERELDLKLSETSRSRLESLLKLRIENQVTRTEMLKRLDSSLALGGIGLYRNTAERVVREIEIIMLLKYA